MGTVDEGIHAMAERKLRLDAAVLDGVTANGDARLSGANVETAQVMLPPAITMHLPYDSSIICLPPQIEGGAVSACLT